MLDSISVTSAFIIGLLGASHCLGMCGGISASMCIGSHGRLSTIHLLGYNLGRISSYTLAGALFGSIGWSVVSPDSLFWLRTLAASMLILMGLYVGQWYRGLSHLEAFGAKLWRYIQPISRAVLPVKTPGQALILGALWGWLPCGLVYSTLLWSAAAADPIESAQLMFAFGLGTLPAMLLTGYFSLQVKQLLQQRITQQIAGGLLVLFGIATLPATPLMHFFH